MSIGFLGISSSQKTIDVFSGNASSIVDRSLQGTLSNYDSIRTDISRLVDNAVRGSFDISSQQYYNSYNKEAVTGWAETWYAEYKAVLALRADALQKKLQAAYNKVLDKSAYTEIKPNSDSVFAPYANRTHNVADTTYKMPVSEIFYSDVLGPTPFSPDPVNPSSSTNTDWTQRIIDSLRRWGDTNVGGTVPMGNGIAAGAPNFNRNAYDFDGDGLAPLSDNGSNSIFDPRDILGLNGGGAQNNAYDRNNVMSPGLQHYRSENYGGPLSVYHIRTDNSGANRYYKVGGGSYNFGGSIGLTSSLTPAQYASLGAHPELANWRFANTAGAIRMSTGEVLDSREVAELGLTAANGPISGDYNISTSTTHNYWIVGNLGNVTDITGDGLNDNISLLRNSNYYGLFVDNYSSFNDSVTNIDSSTTQLVNPLLWDDIIINSTTGAGLRPQMMDSRAEAFASVARNAQVDAAIKGVWDALQATDPNLPTTNPEVFADVLGTIEDNIRDLFARMTNPVVTQVDINDDGDFDDDDETTTSYSFKNLRDFILPFGAMQSGDVAHPWGSDRGTSLYNLGKDYASASPGTNAWNQAGGFYTFVRSMMENAAGAVANIPADQSDTQIPSAEYEATYWGDEDRGNPKRYIPQFGMGDIDWSAVGADIYDTLMSSPDSVGAIEMAIDEINRTFIGRQYNDIIGGSKYEGEYLSVSMSVIPGPLQLSRIIDSTKGLALGGTFVQAGASEVLRTPFSSTRLGPNLYYGHLSSLNDLGNLSGPLINTVGGIPTLGLSGIMVTIPIPFVPIHIATNISYDWFGEMMTKFVERLKEVMVESVQVQSYAASSGTAFDTYASKAEYHFSEPGLSQAMDKLRIPLLPEFMVDFLKSTLGLIPGIDSVIDTLANTLEINIGSAFSSIMYDGFSLPVPFDNIGPFPSLLGNSLTYDGINGYWENALNYEPSYTDRIFNYKHSVQGAETRETDTGAFFATNSFLSQFELDNLDYEYWIGTQQNEEYVNMDTQRIVLSAGKELLNTLVSSALTFVDSMAPTNPWGGIAFNLAGMALKSFLEANAASIMYNLMYKDRNLEVDKGLELVAGGFLGVQGKITTEAYNFIEPDKKPFEADSDFNYPAGALGSVMATIFNNGTPDFILDGYASTMRFRKSGNAGTLIGGGAGEIWDSLSKTQLEDLVRAQMTYNHDNMDAPAQGLGPRARAGDTVNDTGHAEGWWADTDLGDINEVFVGSRKVSFQDLSIGFNAFDDGTLGTGKGTTDYGTQDVDFEVRRYTGSYNRIYNNRYNPPEVVNHESFKTGMYAGVKNVDGAKGFYDRRNQYSLNFKTKYDSNFSLFGSQALNPSIGGGIKIAEIDKNKLDDQLITYDTTGINGVRTMAKNTAHQQFGAAPDGTVNDLNRVLYEHLHLRSDGSNLALVNEYRDVFNSGFLKNIFVSGQTYHPSGGGINSSIEIRFDPREGENNIQTNTREYYDNNNYDPYHNPFLTRTKGKASVYLSTYFAYKKRAGKKA